MTEAEAKTRWCPMVRQLYRDENNSVSAMNRFGDGQPLGFCIGSACMMWRWSAKPYKATEVQELLGVTGTAPGEGYCGLAGKP